MEKRWQRMILFFLMSWLIIFSVPAYADEDDDVTNLNVADTGFEVEAVPASQQASLGRKMAAVSPGTLQTSAVSEVLVSASPATTVTLVIGKTPAAKAVETSKTVASVQSKPIPSEIQEIGGFKYPVYMFLPKDYRMDRTYSMIMIAPAEFAIAQEQIEYLSGLAGRKNIFILAPYVFWPKRGTTPYALDQWFLDIKKDVLQRYPINKKHVYLIGKGSGAEYAAYLGTKHAKEFSGVALLGGAWEGMFSQLIHPSSGIANQVPFYVALKAGTDAKARNQKWLDEFQQKGYLLHLVEYQKDEDLTSIEFKASVYDWLETASQNWTAAQAKSHQGWKGKFKKGVKDFFAV